MSLTRVSLVSAKIAEMFSFDVEAELAGSETLLSYEKIVRTEDTANGV